MTIGAFLPTLVLMKEFNIGNSDFKSLIENNNYYIDKTLFIREVIKTQKQILLIPRPRRFGKTMNIRMLKYYFQKDKPEYTELFKGLNIEKAEKDVLDRMGKYPVIYLSFKDAKEKDWNKTYKYIISEIIREYSNHDYLLQKDILKQHEKTDYLNIINESADESKYGNSLKNLSEYLYRYHKEKVVILIDEYDTPIQTSYTNGFYQDAISFMRNLLSGAYKDNEYLYKGVMTGILRVSKESIFTGLNNIGVYTILEREFADKFGLTNTEVQTVLSDLQLADHYEDVKKWYNGYTIGNATDIYNPWSILNYVVGYQNGFKSYWINTSADELLRIEINNKASTEIREQLFKLINGECITKDIYENFIFPDMETKKELLWTLLVFSGYLTINKKVDITRYELRIPNFEIQFVFQRILSDWFEMEIRLTRSLLIDTCTYLVTNQLDKFAIGFKKIIGDTFSYYDTAGTPEKVYQAYTLGLLAILADSYVIRSNRESGDGRYDILLLPKASPTVGFQPYSSTQQPTSLNVGFQPYGVVIEIKQIAAKKSRESVKKFNERINKSLKDAMSQIEENQYYKELIDHGITNIIKVPIVFVGKEAYFLQ